MQAAFLQRPNDADEILGQYMSQGVATPAQLEEPADHAWALQASQRALHLAQSLQVATPCSAATPAFIPRIS